MSFSHSISDDEDNKILVNFNQDFTSLAVGAKDGYKLYDITKIDELTLIYENNTEYNCMVERLFSSSLLALVSRTSPRKLKMYHYKKNTEITQQTYNNTILAVKINRCRLVVCLEEMIFIHQITDLKCIHTIKHIPRNPAGLIALAFSSNPCYLAYPAKNTTGEVNIFDALALENKLTIAAHDNPLVAMNFDPKGRKLATASERGTVIRVFNTFNGDCLYEFRRGYARCVSICSLTFSSDSIFLCASSNTETVHIFQLTESKPEEDYVSDIFKSCVKKVLQSASYLTSVADMMNQWRSFATVKLPFSGSKSVCAISNDTQTPHVLVASTDGYLYVYDLNPTEGGDCTLLRQHRLVDPPDTAPSDGHLVTLNADK